MLEYSKKWYIQRIEKANGIMNMLISYYPKRNPIILDIGCHEGDMEKSFKNYSNNFIIGLDINFQSLLKARSILELQKRKNIEFVQASANYLPIKNKRIDWIICNYVIDYLQMNEREKVIKQLKLILHDKGIIYLTVGNSLFLKLYKLFPKLGSKFVGKYYGKITTDDKSEWISPMNYKFWRKIAEKNNFLLNDVTIERITDNARKNVKIFFKIFYKILRGYSPNMVFILKHNRIKDERRVKN